MQLQIITKVLVVNCLFLSACVSSKKYKEVKSELDQLNSQNQSLSQQNSTLKKQLGEVNDQYGSVKAEYASYKTGCEGAQKKLATYETALHQLKGRIDEVQKALAAGEADFASKGVSVYEKEGRIYVDMQDNLMYSSGSSKLKEEGMKALGPVASALNQYPELQVFVVGHTDSVSFKKGIDKDNLGLSTDRANTVVRTLVGNYNVNPDRLVAAGQGKYGPIADNSTADGRAKNRRTEIILNPDLEKILNALKE
ncbi:hypothetical protein A4D02_28975 [Niastella koreensis]|uniref:OmpA/MotB domain protein n=2 Tax=Niastella koreensis TaxID=354356 RepID=G8TRE2_NIAKG|nr:OmpA family protein [Niastella koreensis]AEW00064.1 OmpA/MotB domain protein [Niastella koreensis GR20-10]OQP49626.1 hypothetical protein A4D02_28975 [Niastella koreensis]